jgi:cyclophilin family peptidyl-prolyl cis-trans isomerase
MDLDLDGKDIGRLDFELFGKSSPKSVNNFLGFVSGDFNLY